MGQVKLVVAEKFSVAKTISQIMGAKSKQDGYFEGNGFIVSYCVGHLVGLAEPEEYGEKYAEKPWKIEHLPIIPQTWKFSVNKDTKKQFDILKRLMNDSRVAEVINACDCAREGEMIFRWTYDAANCRKKVMRLWVQSLEESSIRKGFDNLRPSSDFDNLYAAGLCRAKADFLVGYNDTRLFSAVYKSFLSVGRVQTPTLAMIVERDSKVKGFVKEKFYTVELDCGRFTATSERIDDYAQAEQIVAACKGKTATITAIERAKKTENSPRLFDLTLLQREANRIFGYTAQNTLNYAQKLYEMQLQSYPRSDSQYITGDMADSATMLARNIYNGLNIEDYSVDVSRIVKDSGVTDHAAILPTAELVRGTIKQKLGEIPIDERNILKLDMLRFLCAVAKPYVYETVTAEIECGGHKFTVKGRCDVECGWKNTEVQVKAALELNKVTTNDNIASEMPLIGDKGETFPNSSCSIEEKWTAPPRFYTDGSLLSAMETAGQRDVASNSGYIGSEPHSEIVTEKKGIGTPATRANTIETLIKRGYAERQKKNIVATAKGVNLIKIVPDSIKSPKLTVEWETQLQKIENNEAEADNFMSSITAFTKVLVAVNSTACGEVENAFSTPKEVIGKCAKCGGDVLENQKAYSCGKRCGFVVWKSIAGKTITAAQAKRLLEKGKTDKIKGFKGKKVEFEAALIIKDDFSVGFKF